MKVKERIAAFAEQNKPFYICDHDDGVFSLCLPLNFLSSRYGNYCQEAFDKYSIKTGTPRNTKHVYVRTKFLLLEERFEDLRESKVGL